jgi:gliding motility-associated-like protein
LASLASRGATQGLGIDCELAETIPSGDYCANSLMVNPNTTLGGPPSSCNAPMISRWFEFNASNSFVSIYLAHTNTSASSTLALSVFEASNCEDDFTEILCADSDTGNWIHVELPYLNIGQKYFLRLGIVNDIQGELDFCLNTYLPFTVPGKTCEEAGILCDSQPKVYVPQKSNLPDSPFNLDICDSEVLAFDESWFKWRVKSDGPITFTIDPLFKQNNIDFEFYRLTDGIEGCNLELLRCENAINSSQTSCNPVTGLKLGATTLFLNDTCDNEFGTFLSPVNASNGEAYALRIISQSQNAGYRLNFDSGSEFFNTFGVGFGAVLSQIGSCDFRLNYDANGIAFPTQSYKWNYSPSLTPLGADDEREISLVLSDLGSNVVQVSYDIAYGCIVTEIDTFCLLERLSGSTLGLTIDSLKGVACGEVAGSYLSFSINIPCPDNEELTYSVDGGPYSLQTVYNDLSLGPHEIKAKLDSGCEISKTITIEEEIDFDGSIASIALDDDLCSNSYEFSIELSGELSGDETVTWNFGDEANPTSAIGSGPHLVQIVGRGEKEIIANISSGTACSKEISYTLLVEACTKSTPPTLLISEPISADCNDENGGFTFDIENGCGPFQYFLDTLPIENSTVANLSSGTYKLKVIDKDSCIAIEDIIIEREPEPTLDAGPDLKINDVGSFVFFDLEYNYTDVTISTNSANIQCEDSISCNKPFLEVSESESIVFTLVNFDGCIDEDTVTISLVFDPSDLLYIPNVFSPNDDGVNDVFEIHFPDNYTLSVQRFEVFDRWGNRIYKIANIESESNFIPLWDGQSNFSKISANRTYIFQGSFTLSSGGIDKQISISRTITSIE